MGAGLDHAFFTLDATTNSGNEVAFTTHQIKGQIEKIQVKPTTVASTGSFFLLQSGGHAVNIETIYTDGSLSGTNPVVHYPRVLAQDPQSINISGTNYSEYVKPIINGRIGIAVSGAGSPSENAFDVWFTRLD